MAKGVELGVAYLTLAAETKGLLADIGKSLAQGERLAGESGRKIGASIKKGVEAAEPIDTGRLVAKIEQDQKRLAATVEQTSRKEEDARRKVAIAEQRLAEVRDSGKASTSQVLAAEDRLVQAQNRLKDATGQAEAKQKLFTDALRKSEKELEDAERANKELVASNKQLEESVDGVEDKYQGLGGAIRKALDKVKGTVQGEAPSTLKPLEDAAEDAGDKSGKRFGTALKGALAGLAAYVGVREVVGGIYGNVLKAGELEQSLGAVDAVFEDSAGQMRAWADSASTSVGISKNAYNELASKLGASLKNAGTPMDELGDKTNDLITLGADLSSMFGGTTAEAIDAVSAALRGEMDPIERYGISLNDAALTAKGLEMGIEKTGGAFTTQQKQLITQALLFDQSKDAQGNFMREQDTFAHKQQVAAAQWEDLRTKMGERFLPIATQVMGFISDTAIPAWEKFSDYTARVTERIKETVSIWGPFAAGLGVAVTALLAYRGAAAVVAAVQGIWALATGTLTGTLWGLTAAQWAAVAPIAAVLAGITLLVGGFILAYNKIGWFRDAVDTTWGWIKDATAFLVEWWTGTAFPAMGAALEWVGQKFSWLYENAVRPAWGFITSVISGFVSWLTGTAIPWISGALQTLGNWFTWLNVNIIQPVWYGIRVIITAAIAVVMTVFQGLWWLISNTLGPIFVWLWESVIQPVFGWIAGAISAFSEWFGTVALPSISGSVSGVGGFFVGLWGTISGVFTWITDKIGVFAAWFMVYIYPYISTAIEYIKAGFRVLWNAISAVFTWITDKVGTFAAWFATYIYPYIDKVLGYLRAGFHFLWDRISAIFTWITDKINLFATWFMLVMRPHIDRTLGFLKDGFGFLWDKVSSVWDWISDKISSSWDWIKRNVLEPMNRFVTENVVGAFQAAKDGIDRIWQKIKDVVKEPVGFVVETVINGAFIKNYNKVAEKFGVTPLDEVSLPPGYARGGILPGYQSSKKDDLLTPMRSGEGVLVPEAVRGLGAKFIHGVNAAANSGGVGAARSWARKQGLAAGDGSAHQHAANWVGGESYTSGAPLSGGRGIWGAFQAAASRAGAMAFPDTSFRGVSTKRAAQAWMGRSALNVNTDGVGPRVSVGSGTAGPWGFNQGSSVTVNPTAPGGMVLPILMHEFGHALSLHHTNNPGSLMHPSIAGVRSPSSLDYSALVSAWGKPGEGVKTYEVNGGDGGFGFGDIVRAAFDLTVGKVIDSTLDGFKGKFPNNHFVGIGVNAVKKLVDDGIAFITGTGDGGQGDGQDWTSTVKSALSRVGLPVRDDYIDAWNRQIQSESGGNPRAIQGGYTDVNTISGDLAQGLVQVIGSTFNAYRDPSLPNDRFNPLANLVAGMRYSMARYGTSGMLGVIGKGHGYRLGGIVGERPGLYDQGGKIEGKGLRLIDHQRSTPDYVLTENQWKAVYGIVQNQAATPAQGQQIQVIVPEREGISPNTMGTRIGEGIAWELAKHV